jgi:hypothetical protein
MKRGCRFEAEGCLNIGFGDVETAWLLGIGVSCQSIGASSRSSTNLLELTYAAFTFQL